MTVVSIFLVRRPFRARRETQPEVLMVCVSLTNTNQKTPSPQGVKAIIIDIQISQLQGACTLHFLNLK